MENGHTALAVTYSLIYHFLSARDHSKAAKAVKKAAKESEIISINSSSTPLASQSLDKVVGEWRTFSTRNAELEALNKTLLQQLKNIELSQKQKKSRSPIPSSSEDSDSASSSSSSGEEMEVVKTVLAPATPSAEVDQPKLATSRNESSGSESTEEVEVKPSSATPVADSKSLKRRRTENGTVTTAVEVEVTKKPTKSKSQNVEGNARKGGVPFQRIKTHNIEFHDQRLMDNTFAARQGGRDDYGARASEDLIVTRGSGFRKEKNKKKRGSYRGGEITLKSHSIKFE